MINLHPSQFIVPVAIVGAVCHILYYIEEAVADSYHKRLVSGPSDVPTEENTFQRAMRITQKHDHAWKKAIDVAFNLGVLALELVWIISKPPQGSLLNALFICAFAYTTVVIFGLYEVLLGIERLHHLWLDRVCAVQEGYPSLGIMCAGVVALLVLVLVGLGGIVVSAQWYFEQLPFGGLLVGVGLAILYLAAFAGGSFRFMHSKHRRVSAKRQRESPQQQRSAVRLFSCSRRTGTLPW